MSEKNSIAQQGELRTRVLHPKQARIIPLGQKMKERLSLLDMGILNAAIRITRPLGLEFRGPSKKHEAPMISFFAGKYNLGTIVGTLGT